MRRRLPLILALLTAILTVLPQSTTAVSAPGTDRVAPLSSISYLHSSGRYDRPPWRVRSDVHRWLVRQHPTVATFTEFSNNRRVRALRSALPGWDLYNGVQVRGGDDVVIAWDSDVWALLRSESRVVSRLPSYRTNGNRIPPQRVTTVLLADRLSGATLLVTSTHMPSHVEVSGGLRSRSLRSAKWRQTVANWSSYVRELPARWGTPTATSVDADWNVDLRQHWVRILLHRRFPDLRPDWLRPYPRPATLGRRLVDFALVSGLTPTSDHLLWTTSSDHTAYRARLRWTEWGNLA